MSDTPFLFSFTQKQRAALLAVSQRLQWDSTWDAQLSDSERAIIDDLIYRLMEDESMDEIANAIMYLADRIPAPASCCCDSLNGDSGLPADFDTTVYDDEVGDPPGDYLTWEEWNTDKCKDANWLADEIIRTCRAIAGMSAAVVTSLTVAAVVALLAIFFPPAWVTLAAGYIIFTVAAQLLVIALGVGLDSFGDIADYFEANKQALVNTLYDWQTTTQLANNIIAIAGLACDDKGITGTDKNNVVAYFEKLYVGDIVNDFVANIGSNAPTEYVPLLECSEALPPLPVIFNFNLSDEGFVWEPLSGAESLSHGNWHATYGEGGTGCLYAYMDSGAIIRGGYFRKNIEAWNITSLAGSVMTVRLDTRQLTTVTNLRLGVRFTDMTKNETMFVENAGWITRSNILTTTGKQIESIYVYAAQSGSVSTGLKQAIDNLNITSLLS